MFNRILIVLTTIFNRKLFTDGINYKKYRIIDFLLGITAFWYYLCIVGIYISKCKSVFINRYNTPTAQEEIKSK